MVEIEKGGLILHDGKIRKGKTDQVTGQGKGAYQVKSFHPWVFWMDITCGVEEVASLNLSLLLCKGAFTPSIL